MATSLDSLDLLLGLSDAGVRYFVPRPIPRTVTHGDIDLVVYRESLPKFRSYLRTQGYSVEAQCCRYAFYTKEYKLSKDIFIDVKTSLCFGERKQISSQSQPVTVGLIEVDGYLYPSNALSWFLTCWVLHLVLDKRCPSNSTSFCLFDSWIMRNPRVSLCLPRIEIFRKKITIDCSSSSRLVEMKSYLQGNLKFRYRILSSKPWLFVLRCAFYLWRKAPGNASTI